MDNVGLSLQHAGLWRAFASDLSAFWGRQRRLDTAFSLDDGVTASGSLDYRLPASARQASFRYGLQGSLSDFRSSLKAQLDGQDADVTAFFQNVDGTQGGVSVKAPLAGLRDSGLTFSHSGHLLDFVSQAQAYSESQRAQAKASFSHGPRQSEASLDVSGSLPALQLHLLRQGDLSDLKADGDVSYQGQKVLSASLAHSDVSSSLSHVTPEPLSLSLQRWQDAGSLGASLGGDCSLQARTWSSAATCAACWAGGQRKEGSLL